MKTLAPSLPLAAAILLAYSDCHGTEAEMNAGYDTRNLNFRADGPLPRDEAAALMQRAVPHGYNAFKANVLRKLPDDAQVIIAREGSVCVYVKGNPLSIRAVDAKAYGVNSEAHPELRADEISYHAEKDETRIWWD